MIGGTGALAMWKEAEGLGHVLEKRWLWKILTLTWRIWRRWSQTSLWYVIGG